MTQLQKNDVATNDKPMTVDVLEAIAREVGQMERRHCIGRAQGFDIRNGYAELRAAIEQYGLEQRRIGLALQRLSAGRGSGEPVAWGQLGTLNGQSFLRSNYDRTPYPPPPNIVRNLNLVPLYAAPQPPHEPVERDRLRASLDDWLYANGPNGWIDALRDDAGRYRKLRKGTT